MLLRASLGLYEYLQGSITPSPTNFLQIINLRHLLYVLRGFMDAPSHFFEDFSQVAALWIHEVSRTVIDRIPDAYQRDTIFEKVKELASGAFKVREKYLPRNHHEIAYCYGCPDARRAYRPVPADEAVLQNMMTDALTEYNTRSAGKQQLDVVFFGSVIEKVLKINRALRPPGAHTILVAHEGSGSFELVKVAVKMSDWEDEALYEKDSELEEDWRVHLKEIMAKSSGERRTRHVLHVEERDISSRELLEALDAIAAHGELFQLYSREEMELMTSSHRQRLGPLLATDLTSAQVKDLIRQQLRDDFTMLIQLNPRS